MQDTGFGIAYNKQTKEMLLCTKHEGDTKRTDWRIPPKVARQIAVKLLQMAEAVESGDEAAIEALVASKEQSQ